MRRIGAEVAISRSAVVNAGANAQCMHGSRKELLGWNRESVDRLFRLDHASRLDQLEAAFKALGRSVDVSIKRAA